MKNVPYILTFGQCPRIGISNLPVDPSILDTLHTKEELNIVANFNPVNEIPVVETPSSLDSDVLDKLETFTSDFAVENVKDDHGKEVPKENVSKELIPKENVMVRKNVSAILTVEITQIVACTPIIPYGIRQVQCVWKLNLGGC